VNGQFQAAPVSVLIVLSVGGWLIGKALVLTRTSSRANPPA